MISNSTILTILEGKRQILGVLFFYLLLFLGGGSTGGIKKNPLFWLGIPLHTITYHYVSLPMWGYVGSTPRPVTVVNKGLWGFPTKNLIILVVTVTGCALASKDDYRIMRPRVAAAALRSGAGVSSWLACNAYDTRLDPLFRDTIDAINAWRRYIKIFPCRLKAIHNSMVSHGSRKGPGPLARLTGILKDISWAPVANKTGFLTNGTIHLDWTTTPMKTIKKVLLQGWSEMVASQCNHRKFFDIDSIDIPLTQKIYHKQGYKEQALLDQVITGKSFTIDELRYYDSNQHAACPLCGCSDSRHHRLFQCSSARHIRNKYSTSVQFARKQNKAWWYHCLMPWPKEVTKHWNFLSTVEIIFSLPEQTLQRKHVFTDGTAFFGDHRYYTISGAAVLECDPITWNVCLVDRDLTPGLTHNSYMGEVTGILRALQKVWCMELYLDCQSAVDILQQAINANNHDDFLRMTVCTCGRIFGGISRQDQRGVYEYINVKRINVGKQLRTQDYDGWLLRTIVLMRKQRRLSWLTIRRTTSGYSLALIGIYWNNNDMRNGYSMLWRFQNILSTTSLRHKQWLPEVNKTSGNLVTNGLHRQADLFPTIFELVENYVFRSFGHQFFSGGWPNGQGNYSGVIQTTVDVGMTLALWNYMLILWYIQNRALRYVFRIRRDGIAQTEAFGNYKTWTLRGIPREFKLWGRRSMYSHVSWNFYYMQDFSHGQENVVQLPNLWRQSGFLLGIRV